MTKRPNRAINTFNITQHEVANHITVLEKGYEIMETLEELKAIIDNAPTDATHACIENGTHYQFKVVGLNAEINTGDGWLCYSGCALPDLYGVRLISDIKRIIELMELNQNMHTTVAGYIYGKDWEHWNEFNAGRFRL
ncbi:hypothetical protein [Pseudoalteromonas phage SL25]|nr:hypothetical protein [Pseudoalteromonas phage SL25]